MKTYHINPSAKDKLVASLKKTRRIWLIAMSILVLPIYLQTGYDPSTLVFYIGWCLFLIIFLPNSAEKIVTGYQVKVDGNMITTNKFYKKPFDYLKTYYIRETKHGLSLYTMLGGKLWIPNAIKNYEELKTRISSQVHPNAFRWFRIPGLIIFVLLLLFILPGVYLGYADIYSITVIILSLVTFFVFFE